MDELISLRDSLVELIALTDESCLPEQTVQEPIDEEYALFKVRQNFNNILVVFSLLKYLSKSTYIFFLFSNTV